MIHLPEPYRYSVHYLLKSFPSSSLRIVGLVPLMYVAARSDDILSAEYEILRRLLNRELEKNKLIGKLC